MRRRNTASSSALPPSSRHDPVNSLGGFKKDHRPIPKGPASLQTKRAGAPSLPTFSGGRRISRHGSHPVDFASGRESRRTAGRRLMTSKCKVSRIKKAVPTGGIWLARLTRALASLVGTNAETIALLFVPNEHFCLSPAVQAAECPYLASTVRSHGMKTPH
jgi:hypothetical protein